MVLQNHMVKQWSIVIYGELGAVKMNEHKPGHSIFLNSMTLDDKSVSPEKGNNG